MWDPGGQGESRPPPRGCQVWWKRLRVLRSPPAAQGSLHKQVTSPPRRHSLSLRHSAWALFSFKTRPRLLAIPLEEVTVEFLNHRVYTASSNIIQQEGSFVDTDFTKERNFYVQPSRITRSLWSASIRFTSGPTAVWGQRLQPVHQGWCGDMFSCDRTHLVWATRSKISSVCATRNLVSLVGIRSQGLRMADCPATCDWAPCVSS